MSKQYEIFKAKVFELAKENNKDPETVWANCELNEAKPEDEHPSTFLIIGYEGSFLERDILIAFDEILLQ